jgi:hypothetical protein
MAATNQLLIATALSLAVCLGCSSQEPPSDKMPAAGSEVSQSVSPTVLRSEKGEVLRPGSLVKVGDIMPSAELPALVGKPHTLKNLLGNNLTVVCFWSVTTSREEYVTGNPASEAKRTTDETLQFLLEKIARPFSPKDGPVRVIGINVGDAIEDIRQVPHAFGDGLTLATTNTMGGTMVKAPDGSLLIVGYRDASTDMLPCLLDTKGGLFARIASDGKTPRVYLLDAKGKILWFDVGFARPAREELLRRIQTLLDRK